MYSNSAYIQYINNAHIQYINNVHIQLLATSEKESTTIRKLRKMVSDELTDDIFENYKINYNMITESIKENDSQMKKINSLNRKYKKELNLEKDRTKQLEIIEKNIAEKYSEKPELYIEKKEGINDEDSKRFSIKIACMILKDS